MHGFHTGPRILIRVIAFDAIMVFGTCAATHSIQQTVHNGDSDSVSRYRHRTARSPLIRHWIISVDPVAVVSEKSRVIFLTIFQSFISALTFAFEVTYIEQSTTIFHIKCHVCGVKEGRSVSKYLNKIFKNIKNASGTYMALFDIKTIALLMFMQNKNKIKNTILTKIRKSLYFFR